MYPTSYDLPAHEAEKYLVSYELLDAILETSCTRPRFYLLERSC